MEVIEPAKGTNESMSIFPNLENPLEIKIPLFEGPLDLLLHLIRKKEVSIAEVQLSELTASYLEYMDMMQTINLDLAGEFLEIAAMLILIKSRHLLPKPPVVLDDFEEEDPEEILRQRLLEYQRYKNAAIELSTFDMLGRDLFNRPETLELVADLEEINPEFEEVSVYALMEAFERVMKKRPKVTRHFVEAETMRIEDKMDELIFQFGHKPRCLFEELFTEEQSRSLLIITFMSILEMVKLHLLTIVQMDQGSSIHCTAHVNFQENLKDWYHTQNDDDALEETLLKVG